MRVRVWLDDEFIELVHLVAEPVVPFYLELLRLSVIPFLLEVVAFVDLLP